MPGPPVVPPGLEEKVQRDVRSPVDRRGFPLVREQRDRRLMAEMNLHRTLIRALIETAKNQQAALEDTIARLEALEAQHQEPIP